MSAYRFVALVEDGPGVEQRLHRAEDILDSPQLFVLQRHFRWGQIGVGGQHPFPVIARFLLQLVFVHCKLLADHGGPWSPDLHSGRRCTGVDLPPRLPSLSEVTDLFDRRWGDTLPHTVRRAPLPVWLPSNSSS